MKSGKEWTAVLSAVVALIMAVISLIKSNDAVDTAEHVAQATAGMQAPAAGVGGTE